MSLRIEILLCRLLLIMVSPRLSRMPFITFNRPVFNRLNIGFASPCFLTVFCQSAEVNHCRVLNKSPERHNFDGIRDIGDERHLQNTAECCVLTKQKYKPKKAAVKKRLPKPDKYQDALRTTEIIFCRKITQISQIKIPTDLNANKSGVLNR